MATSLSPRRERRDAVENCQKVMRAARTLFARHGLETGMEEIAREAGVGVGTIYRRYPSKEMLLGALVEESCALLYSALEEDVAVPGTPLAHLEAVFERCFVMAAEHARLLDLQAPRASDPVAGPCPRTGAYLKIRELVAGLLQQGMAEGTLRSGDPLTAATVIMELLRWRSCENLRHSLGVPAEQAARCAFDLAIGGLKA